MSNELRSPEGQNDESGWEKFQPFFDERLKDISERRYTVSGVREMAKIDRSLSLEVNHRKIQHRFVLVERPYGFYLWVSYKEMPKSRDERNVVSNPTDFEYSWQQISTKEIFSADLPGTQEYAIKFERATTSNSGEYLPSRMTFIQNPTLEVRKLNRKQLNSLINKASELGNDDTSDKLKSNMTAALRKGVVNIEEVQLAIEGNYPDKSAQAKINKRTMVLDVFQAGTNVNHAMNIDNLMLRLTL